MQREGGVHEEGPAEPALVRVQQTTRKNTGPGLQPCLPASPFNSIPAHTYPGSSGPSQETGSTFWPPGRQGKGHVLSESLCKHARSWRPGSFWATWCSPAGQGQVLWLQSPGLHLTPFSNSSGPRPSLRPAFYTELGDPKLTFPQPATGQAL